jgi:hypothetical protein
MTPPPDPRRTDREALARRRTTQVEAALTLARTLLDQRKLDEALDACQQALTLDETNAGALELEQEIQTALRIHEGVEIAADDSALTAAADPSSFTLGLASSRRLESQAMTRLHEEAFVVTGLPPESSERPLTAPVPTSAAPVAVATPAVAAPTVPRAVPGVRPVAGKVPLKWVGAGVLVVAGVALAVFMLPGGVAPTGTAVIEAVPWANITEIRNQDGNVLPLPPAAATPFSLALPAGTYEISLAGPPPESKKETVTLRVEAGRTNVGPITRFHSLTVDEYFDEVLGGGR